jgi:hypothetical protein
MTEMDKTTRVKAFGEDNFTEEPKEEMEQPKVVEEVTEKNKWFQPLEDGTFIVHTSRDGDFVFEDIPYENIIRAKKRVTRRQNDGSETVDTDKFELAVISESLVKPKIGELELLKKKSSTVMKLKAAIYKMYDLDSFL